MFFCLPAASPVRCCMLVCGDESQTSGQAEGASAQAEGQPLTAFCNTPQTSSCRARKCPANRGRKETTRKAASGKGINATLSAKVQNA
eukprot:1666393-Rhodomonas_salina.1